MKKINCYAVITCALLLVLLGSCDGIDDITIPNEYVNLTETTHSGLDSLLKDEMEQQDLVGMSVGVFDNSNVRHLKSYGFKDWQNQQQWDLSDNGHWASISKPLTAVAAFKLIEDGHMSLSEKVGDSLSYWPSTGQKGEITIGQLLLNRSGIDHYNNGNENNKYTDQDVNAYNASQAVDVFDGPNLLFNPGDSFSYSTQGFNLAGAYLDFKAKSAYGNDYNYVKLIQEKVAEPLNMTSLTPTDAASGRALSHKKNCNFEFVPAPIGSTNYIMPGGGWSSQVGDMLLFGKGLMEEQLLNSGSLSNMWMVPSGNSNYAYGWRVRGSGTNQVVYHGGSKRGFKTLLVVYPQQEIVVAIMTNSIRNGSHRYRIFELIADYLGYTSPFGAINSYTIVKDIRCDTTSGCLNKSTFKLSGVWRTGNTDQLIRRGLQKDEFGEERNRLRAIGYHIRDLEIYKVGNEFYYDGIFNRQTENVRMFRNWKHEDFGDIWVDESDNGYRLFDIEVVSTSNGTRWSGLFRPGSGGYGLYRGRTESALHDTIASLNARGFRLLDLEPYYDGNNRRWAGVWTKDGLDGKAYTNETFNGFNSIWNSLKSDGYRLIDVEKYTASNGSTRWAGVFYENNSGGALYRNWDICGQINNYYDLKADGREWVDYEVHP